MSLNNILMNALRDACEGDFSRFIGRCTEAQMVGFRALSDAGYSVTMVCGYYHGEMSDSAREFFPTDMHSWLQIGDEILDPTRWVFNWENESPDIFVTSLDNSDYERAFGNDAWMPHFNDHLTQMGFVI